MASTGRALLFWKYGILTELYFVSSFVFVFISNFVALIMHLFLKVANFMEINGLINLLSTAIHIKSRKKCLIIKTADKKTFKVEFEVARQSQTIRNMLDDLNIQEGGDGENILPLTNEEITGPIFKKALIWMEKNRGKPDFQPDDDTNLSNELKVG